MGGIGKEHHERENAEQWARWGFDYLKYDWRPTDPTNAEKMRQALLATDRDFGFCVTVAADPLYRNYWTNFTNSFRNNPDTSGTFENLLAVYNTYFAFAPYLGNRGHYFDLDMLDVGTCRCSAVVGKMSEDEQMTAFSMRVMLSSPIQISSTLEECCDFELSLYCNEEILAVHQDSAFSVATPRLIYERGAKHLHVFEKKLSDGSYAIAFFNLGDDLFVVNTLEEEAVLRNLWAKTDLPKQKTWRQRLAKHSTLILKSPVKLSSVYTI
jgi:alpha-galactosidase